MSDWEIIEDTQPAQQSNSDWDIVQPNNSQPEQESFGMSAAMAVPRIGMDVAKGAYNFAKKIPDYYQKSKTELPGYGKLLYQHPLHGAGQAAAGGFEAINAIAQAPANLAEYGANRLNLLPQSVPNALKKFGPEDATQAINQLFGQPKYPGEAFIRGVGRNAPEIIGAGGLAKTGLSATKSSIKNSILKPHDALENRASEGFKTVSDEVNKRGITTVPVDQELITELRDYFPKTKQATGLLDKASSGDYNSLRKLQSDLYTNGKKNLGSSLEADRMRGAEMFEKREEINQSISDHLKNTGNHDLDEILNNSRSDYRTLQNVYYNENMNNAIVNMVNKNYRKIPNNLVEVLKEDSIPMKQLLDFHPGLQGKVSRYSAKNKLLKKAVPLGLAVGAGGAGGYVASKK